ncbi:MAG: T9SS type A sorting domain-containing protein, partial [Bacteroidales bacterium]
TPSSSTAGVYTVTYTIAASGGCGVVTATTSVTVTAVPTASISYAGTPFCTSVATVQAVTLTGTGAYTGGTFSSTVGLSINSSTGAITPSLSTAGAYTVTYTIPSSGGCAAVPVTTSVTITALPVASFSYTGTPYCSNSANPSPTFSGGGVSGTFSSTAGLNFVSTATGQVNLATSTPGTYTVTNTITASGGCALVTSSNTITITTLPAATISYAGTPFCKSVATAQPVTATGTTGGTYSASPAGLTINSSTGAITPSTSTAGVYTVTYTIAAGGGCGVVTATTSVTITAVPTASISYAGTPFCTSVATAQPVTLTGTGAYTGGTFSSTVGLSINSSTGAITPSLSTAGTYTVTYTIPSLGGCATVPVTTSVTITALPIATISYAGTPFCQTVSTPQPVTLTGTTGGAYTASPIGLSLNSSTGEITPGSSNPGDYTITYTLAPSGGCSEVTAYTTITINALPIATFSYTGSPYCNTSSNPFPTFSGGGVAGTFSSTAGLVFVSTSTGEINLAGSTPGTYTITNTISASGGCEQVSATSPVTITLLPATPGAISGNTSQCPNQAGQIYSIVAVPNATGYNWSVPAGWTITLGSGTPSITVTTGAAGQNGDISVTADNFCGTSAPATMTVIVNQVEVTATLGTDDACYPTVKAAFDKINDGTHRGTIVIKIHGNTTETASAVLNASLSGAANYSTILMYPTGSYSVSGNFASSLIDFNGADNVTIDGRVNQAGSAIGLTFTQAESASANTRTFRFINSAENNVIRYCKVAGSSISATGGVVAFSTATAGNGNDNNTIEYCDITNAGGNRPVNAIYSSGSAGFINSGNIIRNNNIYDFFRQAATSYGFNLAANTSDWTIQGNSLYETTAFVPTGTFTYRAIYITNTSGNNFIISENKIGGRAPDCSGDPLTMTGAAHLFYGIELSVGTTTATSLQGNVIRNFNCTSTSTTPWQGIRITAGAVIAGTQAGNEIGESTGTGSVTLTNSTASATSYGFYCSSTGSVTFSNNIIGSISTVGSVSIAHSFTGILKSGAGTFILDNNTIGSTVTANSIQASSTANTSIQSVIGISSAGNGSITITGNTIANMFNAFNRSTTSGQIVGIMSTGGVNTINNNTINDLSTASPSTGTTNAAASVIGIALTSTLAGQIVSGNSIYNLYNTCNISRAVQVYGIYISNGTAAGTHTIIGNFISNLTVAPLNTSATAAISGIRINFVAAASLVTTTYTNNIITLGTGISTGTLIHGIYETGYGSGTSYSSNLFYFNTVYIGGTTAATTLTYAFYNNLSGNNTTRTLKDNIFCNSRSSSTGTNYHFAIRLAGTTGVTIDFNDYFANGTGGTITRLNTANYTTLASWRTAITAISGDVNTLNLNPNFITAGGTLATDYKINTNLAGITIPGITIDFGGDTRGSTPSMGAWEKLLRKWKGSLSTDFALAANWTDGTVPASGENIIFDDDPDSDCYLDGDRTIGNLTINQSIDKMNLNGHRLALNGNLLLTNSGQIDARSAGSTMAFTGSAAQSISSGSFTADSVYNFSLINSSGVSLAGNLDINGTLDLSMGTLTLGSGILGINGTVTRITGSVTAGSSSTINVGGNATQLSLPGSTFTSNSVNNFTISRSSGVIINSNLSVAGVLDLQTSNPASTQGCLETGSYALLMGPLATTTGPGDVNGIVTRTSLSPNTLYTFGNQFTTMMFSAGGILPSAISVKITLGVIPSWKTDAIQRIYDISQSGGSSTAVTLNLHYLDSELNSNAETGLYTWDYHSFPTPVILEKHAKTTQSVIDNWVSTTISDIGHFANAFNLHPWSLAKSNFVTFMGTKGWRMITSPTLTTSADLLTGFISQGVPGSTYPANQPNFLWFDETDTLTTNMSWRTSVYNDNLVPGRGYYFYVFDSISGIYSDTLPRQMTSSGNAYFPGGFTYSGANHHVTYTPRVGGQTSQTPNDTIFYDTNIDDQGWNLMGNPTISTLDWDAPLGWTKTNIDNTIYIWDPAVNQFRVWNGINGTLENGLISPFQAFWVKASNPSPALSFSSQVLTTGGTFYGGTAVKSKPLTAAPEAINLSLNSAGLESDILISFKDDGKTGPDTWDAYRLEPLSNSWMEFFTLSSPSHTMPLVINNLPADGPECINLPLYVGGQRDGRQLEGTYTMNWEIPASWPADWSVSLNDHSEQKAVSMRREHSYTFTVSNTKSAVIQTGEGIQGTGISNGNVPMLPPSVIDPVAAGSRLKSATELPPFSIIIQKGSTKDDPVYIAPEPALLQNYPNPFGQSTTVRFSLPVPADVTLKIFDIQGHLIDIVVNGHFETGIHNFPWNRKSCKPGFYMLQMHAGDIVKTKKLVITTK